ncbi:MAG: FAD-dependent oxidoreductase [Planctomycetota bacterium]
MLDEKVRTQAMTRLKKKGRLRDSPAIGRLPVPGRHEGHAVVVGSGPAGLFAAYVLGLSGLRVTLLDRGARLEERGKRVVQFHRTRVPDAETNLLFGEGGAGTYSDGKLYTRVDHALEIPILDELVDCGAPPDILYDARAHIGTDRLHRLIPKLRAKLAEAGVSFHWNTRLEGLVKRDRRVVAVRTTGGEIACDHLVLALGHSARDSWTMLQQQGVSFEAKPFQLGVRVEHPQELITKGRYGTDALGPASYNLVCKPAGTYSFCMCPGGRIVASVNEAGFLCTNGMSNARHSSGFANAALVTTFGPKEFGDGAFAGVAFQRRFEEAFFQAGGSDYTAPAQRVPDFLAGRLSEGPFRTSYVLGTRPGRIDELMPGRGREALARALESFDRQIEGFASDAGILVGIETRSSGPVRMMRDPETRTAIGWENLYPIGEGAGYAGGIMSAALDGARSAQRLLGVVES